MGRLGWAGRAEGMKTTIRRAVQQTWMVAYHPSGGLVVPL